MIFIAVGGMYYLYFNGKQLYVLRKLEFDRIIILLSTEE